MGTSTKWVKKRRWPLQARRPLKKPGEQDRKEKETGRKWRKEVAREKNRRKSKVDAATQKWRKSKSLAEYSKTSYSD